MKNITLRVKRSCPNIAQITLYVLGQGWVKNQTIYRTSDRVAIWDEYVKGEDELRIIASDEFSDYEIHCGMLIEELADRQQRDSFDVYNDIMKEWREWK